MKKKILITQSNYLPWKGYFDAINAVDELVIYDDMQFTKRDWRNRNKIKTSHGLKWLTIPVDVKGKYYQKINETKINDPEWGKKHWVTINQVYGKARFFKQEKDFIEDLFLDNKAIYLSRVNQLFIERINGYLGINTVIKRSEDFDLQHEKTERLVDICLKAGATDYCTGPAAKDYINESLFTEAGISIDYFDYTGYPEYPQLYGEFEHGVTILDLIFNVGPEAVKYMKFNENFCS